MDKPLVSICSITYNHAPYIRQCLDSMLMQKTNFPFEIIINDDCSTDGTTEIIREYAERHPDIIHPIFHEENQYSKGVRGMFVNFVFPKARGKYIAICEGDDYWTDPLKLQKQIDFLEAHPEYTMCFHNAIEHYEFGDNAEHVFSTVRDDEYTGIEIYKDWTVPTASVVFKKEVCSTSIFKQAINNKNFIFTDIIIFLSCATVGKLRGMSDVMSVYRRHLGGMTIKNIYNTSLKLRLQYLDIYKVFGDAYKKTSKWKYALNTIHGVFLYSIVHPEIKTRYDILFEVFKTAPADALIVFKNAFIKKMKELFKIGSHQPD